MLLPKIVVQYPVSPDFWGGNINHGTLYIASAYSARWKAGVYMPNDIFMKSRLLNDFNGWGNECGNCGHVPAPNPQGREY